jgi:hypothetical protein
MTNTINYSLMIAAALLLITAMAHSYLGERYLLKKLFKHGNLPPMLGSRQFTQGVLRFAWHLTSVAWLGLAAVLLLLAQGAATPEALGWVLGTTFGIHGLVSLLASRGKHLSWVFFLAIGVLSVLGTGGLGIF